MNGNITQFKMTTAFEKAVEPTVYINITIDQEITPQDTRKKTHLINVCVRLDEAMDIQSECIINAMVHLSQERIKLTSLPLPATLPCTVAPKGIFLPM